MPIYDVTLKYKFMDHKNRAKLEERVYTNKEAESEAEACAWMESREMDRYGKKYLGTISVKARKK